MLNYTSIGIGCPNNAQFIICVLKGCTKYALIKQPNINTVQSISYDHIFSTNAECLFMNVNAIYLNMGIHSMTCGTCDLPITAKHLRSSLWFFTVTGLL